jgi:initiation factor 1A
MYIIIKMVKNTTGGSKTKGQARKHLNAPVTNKLRYSTSELEVYAKVTALLGNGMAEVICIDNKKRLCHIRGKFRGRGKRDNFISRESWLLIGKRDWESDDPKEIKGKIKLPNCDLLEVYTDSDISRLKNSIDLDWSIFVSNERVVKEESDIIFNNEDDEEIILTEKNTTVINDDEIIDIDDI